LETLIVIGLIAVSAIILVVWHHISTPTSDDSEIVSPGIRDQSISARAPSAIPSEKPVLSSRPPESSKLFNRIETPTRLDLSLVPKEFIVLDLETTGLSPEQDEIIEIGAIRVHRDSDRHDAFQTLVRPTERLPKKITEITGITQAMVEADGSPLHEALLQFKEFIGDLPLVAFNASFDMAFIWNAAIKHGVSINNRYTCALKLARRAYPGLPSYRLVDLARMGNLSNENTHRALGDCMRTAPIFMGSVTKIGERVLWDVPKVDWRISVQYHAHRDANRAFVAETRALEAADPDLAVSRYREAMARMYEYEKLIFNYRGDDHIIDRLSLVLSRLGRYEEVIECITEFEQRFPDAQSSIMTSVRRRREKAETKLLVTT